MKPKKVFDDGGMKEVIAHEPLGVIANISAWNYPYFVGGNVFIPALLAGNAVLYKPSEFATLTGLAIARLLHTSGIPDNVFIPLIGGGAVGAALFVAGHSLHLAAMIVNPHFRPEIVLPPELCRHRLYRLRHPGYIGLWLASLGATLLLGYSILAPCFSVYTGLLLSRIIKEERLLCRSTQEN